MTDESEGTKGVAQTTGHHGGDNGAAISIEEVARQAKEMAVGVTEAQISELARKNAGESLEEEAPAARGFFGLFRKRKTAAK